MSIALSISAYFLPPEDDGYDFLDDPLDNLDSFDV